MEHLLAYVIVALGISILLNIILKKYGISQIIGYIFTGLIMVYAFDLREAGHSHELEMIGEFGIVFLMFTIGLEMSLEKLGTMKQSVFGNGAMQVGLTATIVYLIAHYLFEINVSSALIVALAFSLSSTAVVLTYLKASKEIYLPYGQRSMGILIFQDIAVIPILLLIGFLSDHDSDITQVLINTALSAVAVIVLLFVIGKPLMTWLLHFAADSREEELFVGSILVIAVGASVLAHTLGFTYSLGAFLAGVIIAETKYHAKVEADIASFKDLLLGIFFVTVGMKIDLLFFIEHIGVILALLAGIHLLKSVLIYFIIRLSSEKPVALKTSLALSQVGEFSFAIFAIASAQHLLDVQLEQTLVLTAVVSILLTPFVIARVNTFVLSLFKQASLHIDYSPLSTRKNHVIVCGYSVVGKVVAQKLHGRGASVVVVDNNLKHVQEGLAAQEEIYLGDLSKPAIAQAMHIEDAASVIVTLDNSEKKRLICEAVLRHNPQANLVVKVVSLEEKAMLSDLPISVIVDGKREVAKILVEETLRCNLSKS